MKLLEKLDGLGDLLINDQRIIDILREYEDDQDPPYDYPMKVLLYNEGRIYGEITNSDYSVAVFISEDGSEVSIAVHKYTWQELFDIDWCEDLNTKLYEHDLEMITVNELFYPKHKTLFEKLLEVDDIMQSDEFVGQIGMYMYIYRHVKETDIAEIYIQSEWEPQLLASGFIISNNYIAIVECGYSYHYVTQPLKQQRINIFLRDDKLVAEAKQIGTTHLYNQMITKYSDHLCCELMTFRQFLGVNNVKSARNF